MAETVEIFLQDIYIYIYFLASMENGACTKMFNSNEIS